MDRREAILRELNLYPQWKLRGRPVQVVQENPAPITTAADTRVPTAIDTTSFSSNSYISGGRAELSKLGWPQIKQRVRDCTICRLRAGCKQTVFGVGDEKADWLFVGEGPGADEDAMGEPFVGQAGKLLDSMLMAIKLKRGNNVYIANIVMPSARQPQSGSGRDRGLFAISASPDRIDPTQVDRRIGKSRLECAAGQGCDAGKPARQAARLPRHTIGRYLSSSVSAAQPDGKGQGLAGSVLGGGDTTR
jgi:Uracil DNA glycosylase superfamily